MPKTTLDPAQRKCWEVQRYILGELGKQKISQAELGNRIGYTQQRVSYLLTVAKDIPLSFITKTFKALDVSEADKVRLMTL